MPLLRAWRWCVFRRRRRCCCTAFRSAWSPRSAGRLSSAAATGSTGSTACARHASSFPSFFFSSPAPCAPPRLGARRQLVKEKGSLLVATCNVIVLSTSALQNDKLHHAARRGAGDERMRHVAARRCTAAAASTAAATALLIENQKRSGEVRRKGSYCKLVSPNAFRGAYVDPTYACAAL